MRGSLRYNKLLFLLMGSGMGAALALLFAPSPGAELRNELKTLARSGLSLTAGNHREEAHATSRRLRQFGQSGSDRNPSDSPSNLSSDLDEDNVLELT